MIKMPKKYKKFIIISHARSGSNLLLQSLQNNPHISASDELFAGHYRKNQESFDLIMSNLFSEKETQISLVGCKIFYYHLNEQEWNKFVNISDLMIIHLKRKNFFRTLTSMKIASKTQKWGSTNKKSNIPLSQKVVKFNCENLKKRIEQIESWQIETEARFKNHKIHNIYYEDMISNPNVEIKELSRFLDLDTELNFSPKLKKQNPESLSDLIENYQEIYSYFENTKWHDFLNE